jgi:hypothetical protein
VIQQLSILSIVLATACASTPAGPAAPTTAAAPASTSPNPGACPEELGQDAPSSLGSAVPLPETPITGCNGRNDDGDTFVLTAPEHPAPVLYRIDVTGDPDARWCIKAHDADREGIGDIRFGWVCSGDNGFRGWLSVQGGTRWHLTVFDQRGDAARHARPWTLNLDATAIGDREPDSDRSRARELTVGQPAQSFCAAPENAPGRDRYLYSITVREPGPLSIAIEDGADEIQWRLLVHDSDQRELANVGATNNGANLRHRIELQPGTYVLTVENMAGHGTPTMGTGDPPGYLTRPYTITVARP